MADPVTLIQSTADTINASNSLLVAISTFLPTAGYAITALAAFVPQPDDDAPKAVKVIYRAITYIAFNINHAKNRNVSDSRNPGNDNV